MSLQAFVKLIENEPGCASSYPGFRASTNLPPPRSNSGETVPSFEQRLQIAGGMDAARMYQFGEMVGGEIAGDLMQAAESMFIASGAGHLTPADLYQLVLGHWPPPPPSPFLRLVEGLATTYAALAYAATQGHGSAQVPNDIRNIIQGTLGHGTDVMGPSGPHGNALGGHRPLPLPIPHGIPAIG